MNRDRQTIFALVAAGRISAAEAERLLAAASDARETLWIVAICAIACFASLPGAFAAQLAHAAQPALVVAAHALHHVLTIALHQIGGRP